MASEQELNRQKQYLANQERINKAKDSIPYLGKVEINLFSEIEFLIDLSNLL